MINFEERLQRLKERRQGRRELNVFDSASHKVLAKAYSNEDFSIKPKELYETLKESNGVKYTIGAMAEVDKSSTNLSINEGDRVANNLISRLKSHNVYATKKMQGSVALNIHIEGHSDVDMLIVLENPIRTERPYINPNDYSPTTDKRSMVEIVQELRIKSEEVLPICFPKVNVNTGGSKSIALEGGSLERKVDIVPSCWYHSRQYQSSKREHERGIYIYHKDEHDLLLNYPFKHIHVVNEKDDKYSGNLKSVIRLMKNMIADMPDYKKKVAKRLSSYDLAAIAFHMNDKLFVPNYFQLGLVEKTREHLDFLKCNEFYRNQLNVPDETRKIFDDDNKIEALNILAAETADLAKSIFEELKPHFFYDSSVILNKRVSTPYYW